LRKNEQKALGCWNSKAFDWYAQRDSKYGPIQTFTVKQLSLKVLSETAGQRYVSRYIPAQSLTSMFFVILAFLHLAAQDRAVLDRLLLGGPACPIFFPVKDERLPLTLLGHVSPPRLVRG
jgi:hypothetical protein